MCPLSFYWQKASRKRLHFNGSKTDKDSVLYGKSNRRKRDITKKHINRCKNAFRAAYKRNGTICLPLVFRAVQDKAVYAVVMDVRKILQIIFYKTKWKISAVCDILFVEAKSCFIHICHFQTKQKLFILR